MRTDRTHKGTVIAGVRASVWLLVLLVLVFFVGTVFGFAMVKKQLFPYNQVMSLFWPDAKQPAQIAKKEKKGLLEWWHPAARTKSNQELSGWWHPVAESRSQQAVSDRQREELGKLMTLGYVSGTAPATSATGVTVYNPELAADGFNLFTSGHASEAILVSMEGEVLHKWSYDFKQAFPDSEIPTYSTVWQYWRRAYLYENGDLLAIWGYLGLIKLDKDSKLLWAYCGNVHHDLDVTEDGRIFILGQEIKIIPRINQKEPCSEEFIIVLSADGELLKRISLLEALEKSPYASLLKRKPPEGGDLLHTNTIEVLDGRLAHINPAFKRGNVLVCFRSLDTIAIVDMHTGLVVWALTGRWSRQHQPTVLDNGHMLLFNNQADENTSEVLEFDPFTQEVFWSYRGDAKVPFYTKSCGSNSRLYNGNTLISESNHGRAFEVNPDKKIVWEFVNPNRALKPGTDTELIASILEMIRLPADFPLEWTVSR